MCIGCSYNNATLTADLIFEHILVFKMAAMDYAPAHPGKGDFRDMWRLYDA